MTGKVKMTKITRAPQAVIDEFNRVDFSDRTPIRLFEAIGALNSFNNTNEWLEDVNSREKQLAIIDHVYRGVTLQPEREPKYYVSSEDNDDETVVYFMTDLGIIDCALFDIVLTYENGFSKQLAEAIVAEVGGEIKEIK